MHDFSDRELMLTRKLMNQVFLVAKKKKKIPDINSLFFIQFMINPIFTNSISIWILKAYRIYDTRYLLFYVPYPETLQDIFI